MIDYVHSKKWKLTAMEAFIFEWLYTLPSWADSIQNDGKTYYFASRNKAVSELEYLDTKPDTVYRAYRSLESKGVVSLVIIKKKDYILLTDEGKKWMQIEQDDSTDKNPLNENDGKISVETADKNPNLTADKNPTNNNTYKSIISINTKDNNKQQERLDLFSSLGLSVNLINYWLLWIDYKNSEFKDVFKEIKYEAIALNKWLKHSKGSESAAILIIENSIANKWRGLFPLKKEWGTVPAAAKDSSGGFNVGNQDYSLMTTDT